MSNEIKCLLINKAKTNTFPCGLDPSMVVVENNPEIGNLSGYNNTWPFRRFLIHIDTTTRPRNQKFLTKKP
jgi:hypothetical protein